MLDRFDMKKFKSHYTANEIPNTLIGSGVGNRVDIIRIANSNSHVLDYVKQLSPKSQVSLAVIAGILSAGLATKKYIERKTWRK